MGLDWTTMSWKELAPIKVSRFQHACVNFGGKIYVAGGFDGHNRFNSVEIFDPSTGVWTDGPQLPRHWSAGQMVALKSKIVIIGGYTDEKGSESSLFQLGG